ncbi:MAG: efflux RND transporter periplasmic adaptor subunit [Candidatus Acidiferrales bacterium]
MKRIFPILLIVAALAAVFYFYVYPRWIEKPKNPNAIVLSGNVEAHESLVSFKVTGRVTDLPVEEGQSVSAGQLLAQIDNADYRQQVAADEATVEVKDKQLDLALAGSRSQDIAQAQQNVRDAQDDLAQKQRDYDRYEALFQKDEIEGQTVDQAKTAVARAQVTLDRLKQALNELIEGTRQQEIAVDRADVQQAVQTAGISRIRVGYTTLTAPFTGVITVREAELGEVVAPGTPIYTLDDLQHIWVQVYVPETNLGQVHWGQDCSVTTDTYPGRTYHGRVSFISSQAEFTPKTVQTTAERVTLVYLVKVDVDNPNLELKPGMPADVSIQIQ